MLYANTYMEALECIIFLQEDFLKVFIQTSILNSFDLVLQRTGAIRTFIEEGLIHVRIIYAKFG